MATWFVSRHQGALAWFERRGIAVDHMVPHLEPMDVGAGDLVIGTLPVSLAAAVCARGAQYVYLTLQVPPEWRGQELSAAQMEACNATLEAFEVRSLGPWCGPGR